MPRFTLLSVIISFVIVINAICSDEKANLTGLLQQADLELERGNFKIAAEKYRQALDLPKKGDGGKTTADTLFKLGVTLRKLSKFSDARSALNEALKMHEELADKIGVGNVLTELSIVNGQEGNYDQGLVLAEKALVIHEQNQNISGVMDTYKAKAMLYFRKSDFEKASEYANRSLEISTRTGNKTGFVESLFILGSIHWELGEFDKSLEHFQNATSTAEQLPDPTNLGRIYSGIAAVCGDQGDYIKSLEYYNKSLEVHRKTGSRDKIANCLYNIGTVQGDLGIYEKARESAQQALTIAQQIGDKALTAVCLQSLGSYEFNLGNYEIGFRYLQKALDLRQKIGDKASLAFVIKSIGRYYEKQGDDLRALQNYQKALQLLEQTDSKRPIALTLNNIGAVQARLGDHNQALQHYQKALSIGESIGIKPSVSQSYLGIGSEYYYKAQMNEAETALTKSIEISKSIWYPRWLWRALYKKGLVCRDTGKIQEAIDLMQESVDVIEGVRGGLYLAEERATYFEEKLDVYIDLIRLLVSSYKISEAFEFVQKAKARSFLDVLSEAKIDAEGGIAAQLKDRKKALLTELVSTQKNIQSEYEKSQADLSKINRFETKRNELDIEYTKLMLEIRKENPRFNDLKYSPPLKLRDAQVLLDEHSVLLEYFLGKEKSFLFVVSTNDVKVLDITGEQKLTDQIKSIREVLLKPEQIWEVSEQAHSVYVKLASELYQELIAPAQGAIQGKRRIVVAADGALNYLPFECLLERINNSAAIDFTKLPYVTNSYEIHYVPSVSVLAAVDNASGRNGSSDQKEFLAFANPSHIFSAKIPINVTNESLPSLKYAELEVERIAALYPEQKATLFEGRHATEKNLKGTDLGQFKKVHFASHGIIDEDRPEFSALLLSDEKGSGEDGNLTLREIFDLKLNADLVVLSSCKTGLGKQLRGEGIIGLSRAFLCAGTSSVLVSLWNVYDQSTADFMTTFYRTLTNGKNKSGALREARLQMIRSKKYSHPYYWAPFVLFGKQ